MKGFAFWPCKGRNLVSEWFIKKVILESRPRLSSGFSTREGQSFHLINSPSGVNR